MVGISNLSVNVELINSAAADLYAAADALEATVNATSPVRGGIVPAGIDEASTTVHRHLSRATNSHDTAARQGINQLRTAADTLRKHAANFAADDVAHGNIFGALLG